MSDATSRQKILIAISILAGKVADDITSSPLFLGENDNDIVIALQNAIREVGLSRKIVVVEREKR